MEFFSLLRKGKFGGGTKMRNTATLPTAPATTTTTIAATALCSDSHDGGHREDEGPFFDLEFALPVAKDEQRYDQKQRFSYDEESSEDETELDLPCLPEGSLLQDHILSLSPSDELFFKESSSKSSEKPQVAAFRVKSAVKHKKPEPWAPDPNAADSPAIKAEPAKQNKFFVKFKVEEVPIMSLFTRENSYRSSSSGRSAKDYTDLDAFSPEDKKMSPDVLQKYLSKIKPLYVRVSKRYGEKIRFSGPLSSSTAGDVTIRGVKESSSTPLTGNLPAGLRVVCQRLRKSRSASAAMASVRSPVAGSGRHDDTLLAQHDGIQSAIAHCKQSFNRGSSSPLMRSRSDPGDGRTA